MELTIYALIFVILYILAHYIPDYKDMLPKENFNLEDYSSTDDIDSMWQIRENYNKRLQEYYKYEKPRNVLKNDYCELRLLNDSNGIHFYCKEKTNVRKKGCFFEVKGNNRHAATMWAIIDMEFTGNTDYYFVKNLYYKLNYREQTTGGMKYFIEPLYSYPEYDDKVVQNEYCRLEWQKFDGKDVIICSEIWSKNPKKFMIMDNGYSLKNILLDFANEKNKFETYDELLAKYSGRLDCKVEEINDINTNKKHLKLQKPEEIEHYKKEESNTDLEENQKDISENQEINNSKFNERNVDL